MRWTTCALLLVLALLAFTAQVLSLGRQRMQPRYDEVHYVSVARDYHRMGGVVDVVRCHLEGKCHEDNRYPTFELVLQAFAHDDAGFYADAKLVTLGTAYLFFLVVFLIVRRRISTTVASMTVAALALMPCVGEVSSGVLADMLFAAVFFGVAHATGAALQRGPLAALGLGALIGLAYLTKGNGHLALLGVVTAGLMLYGLKLARRPHIYLAVLGFLAIAGFLLWRNRIVFGSSLHNFNDKPIWLDDWEQTWRLMRQSGWSEIGMRWYIAHHSLLDLVGRSLKAVGKVAGSLLYSSGMGIFGATGAAATPPVWAAALRVASGLAVLALGVRGMVDRYRAGHRAEVLGIVSVCGWFLLAYAVGGLSSRDVPPRFLLPMAALALPYAICTVSLRIIPALRSTRIALPAMLHRANASRLWLWLAVPLAAKAIWFGPVLAENPRRAFAVPGDWAETSTWFNRHLKPGERYAIGINSVYSTFDVPQPDPDARWLYLFSAEPDEMMRAFHEAQRLAMAPRWDGPNRPITKALVDMKDPALTRFRNKLSTEQDEHGPLSFVGWPRCFADSAQPSRFLVFCQPEAQ